MAVETIYRSSRDTETLFMDRKSADEHDAMLELAEKVTETLERNIPGLGEKQAEEIGIYLAKNRAVFAAAFKNNPGALDALISAPPAE